MATASILPSEAKTTLASSRGSFWNASSSSSSLPPVCWPGCPRSRQRGRVTGGRLESTMGAASRENSQAAMPYKPQVSPLFDFVEFSW